jgi:hypothetical protein
MKVENALAILAEAAGPIPKKKFASMFKLCLTPEEKAKMGS